MKEDLVIRIAGEAGENIQSAGQLLTLAAARAGFHVLTLFSPPSEIKGGPSFFQVRLSNRPLHSQGDQIDILLAYNQEAYQRNHALLAPDGVLLYDPDACAPAPGDGHVQVPLPLTDIAKNQLRFEMGKNVVSVAAMSALFGLPSGVLPKLMEVRFRRQANLMPQNLAAMEAGLRYVEEHFPNREQFRLSPPTPQEGVVVISGNQAVALGAMAAGLGFMAGYPITPASDIMEILANELPRVGGAVVQAEDEIAAMNMVLGASYAGKKAMTATSGPGLSLMVEALGLGVMAEIPVVVVDCQRAGPSTGMPTRHEQGDLYIACFGGHGEAPRLVLAPTSVEDAFYQTINAFNLAEKYQTPVILLSDTVLAVRTQTVRRPNLDALKVESRLLYQPREPGNGRPPEEEVEERYLRYRLTKNGVSPMAIPGQPGGQYVATGLEHSELGRHRTDPAIHTAMTEKRHRKLQFAALEAPPAERYGDPGAEIGVLTWGSSAGAVIEAIDKLAARGLKVEMLAPKLLRPLPDHQIRPFLQRKRTVMVAEVNYSGQFADLLAAHFGRPFERITVYGGQPFNVERLAASIAARAVEGVTQHV